MSYKHLTGTCPLAPPFGRGQGAQYKRKLPYREAPPFRAGGFHHLFDGGVENLILRGLLGCPEENDSKDHIRHSSRKNGYR